MGDDADLSLKSSPWKSLATAGAIAGAIPFVIHFSSSSMTTVNGEVTSLVYRDWIAVSGGAVAAALGVATLIAGRASTPRGPVLLATVALLALGAYQLATGFGVFAG